VSAVDRAADRAALLRPGTGRAAPFGRMVAAQLGMELRLTLRRGENLLATLVLPVLLLVFFSAVPVLPAAGAAGDAADATAVSRLLPGVLAIAIVAAGLVNLGIATAFERGYGVLKRLGGTPLPRSGLLSAKIGAVLVVEAVQAVLLLGVAMGAFGWTPGPGWSPAVVAAAVVLGTFTFSALGLLLAGTLRPEATLALANGLFVLAMLLGGLLVPASGLPGILGEIAALTPTAALADALRVGLDAPGAAGAAGGAGAAAGSLALLAAWGVSTAVAAARWFRWE
jgi:ABC-2 type transport system permease protein